MYFEGKKESERERWGKGNKKSIKIFSAFIIGDDECSLVYAFFVNVNIKPPPSEPQG